MVLRTVVALCSVVTALAQPAPVRAQVDHLVVAIRSLPEGVAEFERLLGVEATIGGKHPGRGTENALVSLGGGTYLEIIAPQEGATLSPTDEPMRGLDRLRIIGWAVSVSDATAAANTLKTAGFATTPLQPGSRVTPSGESLQWTTFGLVDGFAVAPFFINWGASTKHPSTTSPGGCELTRLTITDPRHENLSRALGALHVSRVLYAQGTPRIEAALRCGTRTAILTTP